jgi:hypothetical protein
MEGRNVKVNLKRVLGVVWKKLAKVVKEPDLAMSPIFKKRNIFCAPKRRRKIAHL